MRRRSSKVTRLLVWRPAWHHASFSVKPCEVTVTFTIPEKPRRYLTNIACQNWFETQQLPRRPVFVVTLVTPVLTVGTRKLTQPPQPSQPIRRLRRGLPKRVWAGNLEHGRSMQYGTGGDIRGQWLSSLSPISGVHPRMEFPLRWCVGAPDTGSCRVPAVRSGRLHGRWRSHFGSGATKVAQAFCSFRSCTLSVPWWI
jgi:hypothetical protein